ncbi:N1R/p28-like protein [Choristoneura rosaceana entomopoxvirus 'L']|uniref:N1R/p28-like protein n=1 Tax=Choristoneura rosaceana entomopoxvirus 'L' TaxID=1293539 RepID=A0ABM9QK48_9POXV|nr:N1R/p28-like protein [Choristoneura rosaceana entomopoxvirus 'L']CCU55915.1 N1R/p28-like protein [Choristoneura rosaceana entomopoxvirus 'L']
MSINTQKPKCIIDFIKDNDYKIELGDWFKDIWCPLFKQEDILITNNVLYFIRYGISGGDKAPSADYKQILKKFIDSMNNYNINYIEIKYDNPLALEYEYIQNDIKNITPNNLSRKTWILLSVRNFKKLILSLRTKTADEIREYYITLEEIIEKYNEYLQNYELAIRYKFNPNIINIFEFINQNNYNLVLGTWFKDIWYPLFNQKDILITNNILSFIFNGIPVGGPAPPLDYRNIKKKFKDILHHHNIIYKIINYEQIKNQFNYYINNIKNDTISISPNNLNKITWFIMSVRNFKSLLMKLNTKIAQEIREYYITIEEILYDYSNYTNNYYREIEKLKLLEEQNKLKEIENINAQLKIQKEEAERKSLKLKEKLIEEKKHKIEQVIYVSTSQSYSAQNRFKIGGVDNITLLKPRLSTYNSRSAEGDEWYYSHIKKVNNYKQFENRFWSVMSSFRDKKDKEILILYYDDLINIFEFISENYDKDIEYFNDHVKEYVNNLEENKYNVPEPCNLELINICSIKNGKIDDNKLITANRENIEKEIKDYLNFKVENNEFNINRKDIINHVDKKYKYNKREIWSISKELKSIFKNIILKY